MGLLRGRVRCTRGTYACADASGYTNANGDASLTHAGASVNACAHVGTIASASGSFDATPYADTDASTRTDGRPHASAYAGTVVRAHASADANSTAAGTDASTIVDVSANARAYAGTVA